MFLSNRIGISSRLFGNSATGASGILNQSGSFVKIGWSKGQFRQGWGMKIRFGIGANGNKAILHGYVPFSFVPNSFANSTIILRRHLYRMGSGG